MTLDPIAPRRPLIWLEIIDQIANAAANPARLYLVGGAVRDALRGQPIHDVDLATPDDGLRVARQIANALGGAYYPVDEERHTGRAILPTPKGNFVVDVASFRADDLLGDLQGRDFTINAIAVQLDRLDELIDPLGGQADLFDHKILRECSPVSIANDPIRALRAIRMGLQFNLRLAPETKTAARLASPHLSDATGQLNQPERVRDEVFKILNLPRQGAALRLMHTLGLLAPVVPFPLPNTSVLERTFSLIDQLNSLLTIISAARSDNTAADLMLGVAVMVLDRFRTQLQDHLWQAVTEGRTRAQLLILGALTPLNAASGTQWLEHLRLATNEKRMLDQLFASSKQSFPPEGWAEDQDRAIYRYYRAVGESGIEGIILALADYLTSQGSSIQPEAWGTLLDEVASPLLEAFFRRYQTVIAPPPLLTGNDLMSALEMTPGKKMGNLLAQLVEEQAAGTIRSKKEALRFAKRFLNQDS